MGVLRVIGCCGVIAASTVVIVIVAADRLSMTRVPPPPTAFVARVQLPVAVPEPETTGTVMQTSEEPAAKPAKPMSGFDTESLRALMRGDALPASRKR